MKTKLLILTSIIFLSVPALLPLFREGFFLSDDAEWMVIRFSAFYQSLADGQFPVRFLGRLNHEYGYPVANFLYPGFMYLGVLLRLLGFGFVDSIKILFGASLVLSSIFCFYWLSYIFRRFEAFVGALLYLYLPYHLYDVYKRGSVGEVLALAVLPFIFWNIERKNMLLVASGLGFLILSHNTLALLLFPVVAIYMLIRKKFDIRSTILSFIFGLGISSFFWFPAIYDLRYTAFSKVQVSNWRDHFASPDLIGYITIVLYFTAAFVYLRQKIKGQKHMVLFFLTMSIICSFLSSPLSSFAWEILPVGLIQFPFRFLSVSLIGSAFLVAYCLNYVKSQWKIFAGVMTACLVFVFSFPFIWPKEFFNKGDSYYSTNVDTTTVKNEYMPLWVKKVPDEIPQHKILIKDGEISDVFVKTNTASFTSKSDKSSIVTFNTIYFPGWVAKIDGKDTQISFRNDFGVMNISVPPGKHSITFSFKETSVRLISDILSLVSFGMLFAYTLRKRIIHIIQT